MACVIYGKKITLATFVCSIFSILALTPTYADTVYLKSGEKIEGKIFRNNSRVCIIISDAERGIVSRRIRQEDADKIEEQATDQELIQLYTDSTAYYQQGKKALDSQENYWAMENFKKVTELNPKYAQAHFSLGLAYFNLGYKDNARNSFEKARDLAKSFSSPTKEEQDLVAKAEDNLRILSAAP